MISGLLANAYRRVSGYNIDQCILEMPRWRILPLKVLLPLFASTAHFGNRDSNTKLGSSPN